MPAIIELQISAAECEALKLALPLAKSLNSSNPDNNKIFTITAATAMDRLEARSFRFTFAEIRTMAAVLSVAVSICHGKKSEYLSPETPVLQWRALLLPHLLPLSRLELALGKFVAEHLD